MADDLKPSHQEHPLSPASRAASGSIAANSHLPVVDGLRGLAILGVIWHHLTFVFLAPNPHAALPSYYLWAPFISNGWQGVNLFFFLSGFVLALPYLTGRRSVDTWADIRWFYIRRAKRLLPLFYLVCLFSFLLLETSYQATHVLGFLAAVSLLFNFSPKTFAPPVNWVFWSVGIEIWFSAIFPFVIRLYRRVRWLNATLLIIAVSIAVRAVGYAATPNFDYTITNFISDSVLGRLDDFALGICACHLYLTRRQEIGRFAYPLVAAGAVLWLASMGLWNLRLAHQLPNAVAPLLGSLTNVGVFALFLGLVCGDTVLVRPLTSVGPRLLGLMCYSIYAWHGLLLSKLNYYNTVVAGHIDQTVCWFIAYAVCLGLFSTTTFVFVEFPGTGAGIIRSLLSGSRPAKAKPSA